MKNKWLNGRLIVRDEVILSIIVLTYNQEEYIDKTLRSIVEQKHGYTYELIVSDDCSKDNTRSIIDEYYNLFPGIIVRIYNEENMGVVRNYFNALSICQGKYIMCCGGDDYWLQGKISDQISYIENNDVGLVCGQARAYSQEKEEFTSFLYGTSKVSFKELIKINAICASTVCYRRNLVEEYIREVKPLEHNWLMEDYPMWLWFSLNSKIAFIPKEVAVYRELSGSLSHCVDMKKKLRFERNTYEIRWYFSKSGIMRRNIRNDYYRRIADVLYVYGYLSEAYKFAQKGDLMSLDIKTQMKFFSTRIPLIRWRFHKVYLRLFRDRLL